jgi:hypothetical protein
MPYTYYSFDLVTGRVMTEVPLVGPQPHWAINDPGDLGSVTMRVAHLGRVQLSDVVGATAPYRYGVAVDRNGQIIWSGCITTRRFARSSGQYTLGIKGLLAYWDRRLVTDNLTWTAADQFTIVRDLLLTGGAPTVPVDLGVDMSGVLRDRTLSGSSLSPAWQEITQLADNQDGYEIALDTSWDNTPGVQRVVHTLRLGSPRLGITDETPLLLEFPGNVRDYEWNEDGAAIASEVWGSSQSADGVSMVRAMSNPMLTDAGYPKVMLAKQWPSISDPATLDGHLSVALSRASQYGNLPTVVVRDLGDTAAGQWSVGDNVRLRISDEQRFPRADGGTGPGLDTIMRITDASLDPGTALITMTLTSDLSGQKNGSQ